jgi:hypothetical protein
MLSSRLFLLLGGVALAAGGCAAGEADICSMAVEHLKQCGGVSAEAPATCDVERASFVLDIPCSKLGGTRAASFYGSDYSDDLFSSDVTSFLGGEDLWFPEGGNIDIAWGKKPGVTTDEWRDQKAWQCPKKKSWEFDWPSSMIGGGSVAVLLLCTL